MDLLEEEDLDNQEPTERHPITVRFAENLRRSLLAILERESGTNARNDQPLSS